MPIKLSVRSMMLSVAIVAIPLSWAAHKTGQRRDRCLELADRHARLGAEYRSNSHGHAGMVRAADWHDYMSRCFEEAAGDVWGPIPATMPFAPLNWTPPAGAGNAVPGA